MTHIDTILIEATDPTAVGSFYSTALGLGERVAVRGSDEPAEGFRGFTLSLVVAQPADVNAIVGAALEAGATEVKAPEKSLWGYGGSLRAPDGTIVTIASTAKKDSGPPSREVKDLVVQLGVEDVAASKQAYGEHGIAVAKSFGRRYAELDTAPVTVTLNKRAALAKAAGVPPEGSGSHRLAIRAARADTAGFTDPDGFAWRPADD